MSTKLITSEATLSFPHLDVPQVPQPDAKGNVTGKAKFKASLIFLAGTDMAPFEAALMEAATAKWGDKAGKMRQLGQLKWPLRLDGELKGYPEGCVYFNCTSETQPGLVYLYPETGSKKPARVVQEDIKKEFYPGAIVRASVTAFAYDRPDSKGVSFGLNNLQKLKDGPRLDGRKAAEDEFEADLNTAPADLSDLTN